MLLVFYSRELHVVLPCDSWVVELSLHNFQGNIFCIVDEAQIVKKLPLQPKITGVGVCIGLVCGHAALSAMRLLYLNVACFHHQFDTNNRVRNRDYHACHDQMQTVLLFFLLCAL